VTSQKISWRTFLAPARSLRAQWIKDRGNVRHRVCASSLPHLLHAVSLVVHHSERAHPLHLKGVPRTYLLTWNWFFLGRVCTVGPYMVSDVSYTNLGQPWAWLSAMWMYFGRIAVQQWLKPLPQFFEPAVQPEVHYAGHYLWWLFHLQLSKLLIVPTRLLYFVFCVVLGLLHVVRPVLYESKIYVCCFKSNWTITKGTIILFLDTLPRKVSVSTLIHIGMLNAEQCTVVTAIVNKVTTGCPYYMEHMSESNNKSMTQLLTALKMFTSKHQKHL